MQNPEVIRQMFDVIAPRYDLANHFLSCGMDRFWRRRAARLARSWQPDRILDLATGSGDLALTLARHCPAATLVGADFSHSMLLRARAKRLPSLIVADGMHLPFAEGAFDLVTVAFGLRNMASWAGALAEMSRVLGAGGHVIVLDFSLPVAPLRPLYRFYLHRCLPVLAGFITGQRAAYEYLGGSIEQFPSGSAMTRLMNGNGFSGAECKPLSGGIVSMYWAAKS